MVRHCSQRENSAHLGVRVKKNNLNLNLSKSSFFKRETKFVAFFLTVEGIKPDPEKVQGIMEFPIPKNTKQLRGFLGLVNFYSKFSSKHAADSTFITTNKERNYIEVGRGKTENLRQNKTTFL